MRVKAYAYSREETGRGRQKKPHVFSETKKIHLTLIRRQFLEKEKLYSDDSPANDDLLEVATRRWERRARDEAVLQNLNFRNLTRPAADEIMELSSSGPEQTRKARMNNFRTDVSAEEIVFAERNDSSVNDALGPL